MNSGIQFEWGKKERQEDDRWGSFGGIKGLDILLRLIVGRVQASDKGVGRREVVIRSWNKGLRFWRWGFVNCEVFSQYYCLMK